MYSQLDGTEQQLLWCFRDHPWLDSFQAAGLLGVSRRTAQRWIKRMLDSGLIYGRTLGLPDVTSDVYALGRRGVIALAGSPDAAGAYARAFGLDPMGLGRALISIRRLSWVRNLLVSLSGLGQRIEWAMSPARLEAGSRVLNLGGMACLSPWGGRYVQAAFCADTGRIGVEAWRDRMRLFQVWARRIEGLEGHVPCLVMVSTNRRRATQLAALWRSLRRQGRSGAGGLYVAAVSSLAEDQCSWVTETETATHLWSAGEGGHKPIDRPWPQIDSDKGARGGGLGSCMLQGTFGGRAVLDAFGGLDAMAWDCLDAVSSWPLLCVSELALLLAKQTGEIARGLKCLKHHELLEELTLPGSSERRYYVSPLAIKMQGAMHGMRGRQYGRARRWPVGRKGPLELKVNVFVRAKRHTQLAFEFMTGLRRLADHWWDMGYGHQLVIWDTHEVVRYYHDADNRLRYMRPDGGGVYQIGDQTYRFVLEVDLDSGKKRRESKFGRYYQSRRRPGATEVGPMPRLLILCHSEGRARLVNETLITLAERFDTSVLDAYITTIDRVHFPGEPREDGTVERIDDGNGRGRPPKPRMWPGIKAWRRAGRRFGRLTWCFEGLLPSQRYSSLRPFDPWAIRDTVRRHAWSQMASR